jgi:hypothetical protein
MFSYFKPRTLEEQINDAVELARGILNKANLPVTPVCPVKDPQSGEIIGSVSLNSHVIEERGYDCGSLPGIASIIIAMADQLKTDPYDLLLFDFGRHVERLHATMSWEKGPKQERMDALNRTILKHALNFQKNNGRWPKPREAFPTMPPGGCINEIDMNDRREFWSIVWKNKGKIEDLSYKNFTKRLKALEKKHAK